MQGLYSIIPIYIVKLLQSYCYNNAVTIILLSVITL